MTPAQNRVKGAYRGVVLGKALQQVDVAALRLFGAHSVSGYEAYDLLRALRAAVRAAEQLRRDVEEPDVPTHGSNLNPT